MLSQIFSRQRAAMVGLATGVLVVGGALAYAAHDTYAQAATATRTPAPPRVQPERRSERLDVALGERFLDNLARVLGVDRQRLQDAVTRAREQSIEQLVQDGRLTAAQAARLKEHAGRLGPGFGLFGPPDGPRHWPRPPRPQDHLRPPLSNPEVLEAAARLLGMAPEQLREQLRIGKSLPELAREKGVSPEQLRQATAEAAKVRARARLEQAEKDGRLTKEQADRLRRRLEGAAHR